MGSKYGTKKNRFIENRKIDGVLYWEKVCNHVTNCAGVCPGVI
jgi:hypothetical protein